MKVGMIDVTSSFVTRCTWYDHSLILQMGNRWYDIHDVEEDMYERMMADTSVGMFYNVHIKGQFPTFPLGVLTLTNVKHGPVARRRK